MAPKVLVYYLNLIADVDKERSGEIIHGDPAPVLPDLESRDVIRDQDRDCRHVGVRLHTERQLRLGAWRVEVYLHLELDQIASELRLEHILLQSEAFRQQLEDRVRYLKQLPVVFLCDFPKIINRLVNSVILRKPPFFVRNASNL